MADISATGPDDVSAGLGLARCESVILRASQKASNAPRTAGGGTSMRQVARPNGISRSHHRPSRRKSNSGASSACQSQGISKRPNRFPLFRAVPRTARAQSMRSLLQLPDRHPAVFHRSDQLRQSLEKRLAVSNPALARSDTPRPALTARPLSSAGNSSLPSTLSAAKMSVWLQFSLLMRQRSNEVLCCDDRSYCYVLGKATPDYPIKFV